MTDQTVAPPLAGLALALAIVGVQLWRAGNVSAFVHAAPPWADAAAVPAGLRVGSAPYDGIFYYRLALDPFTDRITDHGITFDRPAYRQQRIVYPLLAWAVSGADEGHAPGALVLVNVVGLVALAAIGGMLARDAGRHALWGLLFALYPGFVITLGDDLTEIVAAALALGGLLLLRRARPAAAAIPLAAAVLARETTILIVVAAAVTRLRSSWNVPRSWLPLVAPIVVLGAWQGVLLARWHETAAGEGATSVGLPLVGLAVAAWLDPQRYAPTELAVWVAMIAFVVALVLVGVRLLRIGRPHERLAWYGYAALATVLEANIWANGAIVRTLTELGMLTTLLALGGSARLRWTLLGLDAGLLVVLLVTGPPI